MCQRGWRGGSCEEGGDEAGEGDGAAQVQDAAFPCFREARQERGGHRGEGYDEDPSSWVEGGAQATLPDRGECRAQGCVAECCCSERHLGAGWVWVRMVGWCACGCVLK